MTKIYIELCHNKSRNCSIEKIIYLQSSTSYSTDFCWQLLIRWFDGLYLRHKANLNRESNGRTALYCIEISFEAENFFPLQYIVTVVLKEPDVHYNLARSFGMWNLVTKQYRCLTGGFQKVESLNSFDLFELWITGYLCFGVIGVFVVLLRVSKLFEKRVILGLCNLKRGKKPFHTKDTFLYGANWKKALARP